MRASNVLYKCEDCGCEIVDCENGTAEVTSPDLFVDCETCQRAGHDRMRELGQRMARRINDHFENMLRCDGELLIDADAGIIDPQFVTNGTNASNNIDNA